MLTKGISALTEVPFLSKESDKGVSGVLILPSEGSFYKHTQHIIMKKIPELTVSLYLEFKAPILVKVKAYTRIQSGKVVRVRSYYRHVEGR